MAAIQYNRIIRKTVVGFGNLFNNITLVRYNQDLSEAERLLVPIVYANKELYVRRLEEDPDADKKVQVTLPRMSFEMSGLSYDSTRKHNTNIKNFAQTATGVKSVYNPVPYNFDFNLYIYVRNIEDGTQIIEHILPYFTPDYTIKLNLIPELGVTKEIPVVLNSTSSDVVYEGNRDSETRMIVWTLNFTVKGFIFGKPSVTGLIEHSITSIYDKITPEDIASFIIDPTSGAGDYKLDETVYQGYNFETSTATGKVVYWDRNKLDIKNVQGNFVSTEPIYGITSGASYTYTSHNINTSKQVQIDLYVNDSPVVKTDDTEYTMDSSAANTTTDKINTYGSSITENTF